MNYYAPRPISRWVVLAKFLGWAFEPKVYRQQGDISWIDLATGHTLTVEHGFECDHSTWSPNIGMAPVFHDKAFAQGHWDDGTPMTWREANRMMRDIQKAEKLSRRVRKLFRRGIKTTYSYQAWRTHRAKEADAQSRP